MHLREKSFLNSLTFLNYSLLLFLLRLVSEIVFRKKIVRSHEATTSSKYFVIYARKIGNAMKQVACKICWFNKLFRCPDIY